MAVQLGQLGSGQQACEVTPCTDAKEIGCQQIAVIKSTHVDSWASKTSQFTGTVNCCEESGRIPAQSLQEFCTSADLKGHVLLYLANLEAYDISRVIAAYLDCKLKDPGLSCCIVMPSCNHAVRRIRHMQLLAVYQAGGKRMLTNAEGANVKNGVCHVRYDPPSVDKEDVMTSLWNATIAGVPSKIFLDSGAQANFVDEDFCRRNWFFIASCSPDSSICFGDDRKAPITGKCHLSIKIQHYTAKVEFLVVKLSKSFDAVFGEPWFRLTQATLEYGTSGLVAVSVWKGTRRCRLHPQEMSPRLGTGEKFLNAAQCVKALKQQCTWFFGMIAWNEDEEEFDDGFAGRGPKCAVADADSIQKPGGLLTDAKLREILQKHKSVFPEKLPPGLPPDRGVLHTIPLMEQNKFPFRPPYRMSPLELAEAKKQIAELLEQGFIQESQSPFGAPILFVRKKDGTLRMCIDYRALNKITTPNRYPIPRIDDLLDQMQGATVFSSLDLASGYHQIRISADDVPKTAFTSPFGHYEFKVLCFGLSNAPATFQSVMNHIFRSQIGKYVVVYLDDILIFSRNAEEHAKHLDEVLGILEQNELFAKLSKCDLNKPELLYLGHVLGRDGIKVNPKKVESVRSWPVPKNVHELRSFLGLTNYFRRFIRGYSKRAKALTDLCKDKSAWQWTDREAEAFENLKLDLCDAPVLALPDPSKPYEVVADASDFAIGAVLLQDGRPIAFESAKLKPSEVGWTTTDKEMLASVHAMRTWRCYLEGVSAENVLLITDHNPNTYQPTKDLHGRQIRWSEFLSRFRFTWQHRPGRLNVADPISRRADYSGCDHGTISADHCCGTMTRGSSEGHSAGAAAESSEDNGSFVRAPDYLAELGQTVQEGYMTDAWFRSESNIKPLHQANGYWWHGARLVIPEHAELRQRIMSEHHDTPYSGHLGVNRTERLVARQYWWPAMRADIVSYVQTCPTCQQNKPQPLKPAGDLQPLQIPVRPWSSVSMDLITALPPTRSGNTAIVVFVDRLSKMAHFVATVTTIGAAGMAKLFLNNVFRLHGMPEELVSDRDPRFTSVFWSELCMLLGTKRSMSTAYHPQTDGQTERMNRVLEDMLRHFCHPDQTDWDEHLACAEFAVNNAFQSSVQETPFMINFGQHPSTPATIVKTDGLAQSRGKNPAAKQWVAEMQQRISMAKDNLNRAQQRMKFYADKVTRPISFEIGQRVLLSTVNLKKRSAGTAKLLPKWIGPFPILDKIGNVAYRLLMPEQMRMHNVFHVSLLKAWHDSDKRQPPPATLFLDGTVEFEVERVLDHSDRVQPGSRPGRKSKGRVLRDFLVKWRGYGPEHNTWEPESNLGNCTAALQEYWDSLKVKHQQ